MKILKDEIKTAAASLLGFTSSYQPQNSSNKITVLLNAFVDGAMQEVYYSADWAFGIDVWSKDRLQQVDSSKTLRLDACNLLVFQSTYLRVIATAPSGFNFTLSNHGIVLKTKYPIESSTLPSGTLLGTIVECPDWLILYKKNIPVIIDDAMFHNLCALCLAAQIAYSAYGDANYADAMKKQYISALQQAKQVNRYQANIDTMTLVL